MHRCDRGHSWKQLQHWFLLFLVKFGTCFWTFWHYRIKTIDIQSVKIQINLHSLWNRQDKWYISDRNFSKDFNCTKLQTNKNLRHNKKVIILDVGPFRLPFYIETIRAWSNQFEKHRQEIQWIFCPIGPVFSEKINILQTKMAIPNMTVWFSKHYTENWTVQHEPQ
jgi:hypothetical protein